MRVCARCVLVARGLLWIATFYAWFSTGALGRDAFVTRSFGEYARADLFAVGGVVTAYFASRPWASVPGDVARAVTWANKMAGRA